MTKKQKQHLLAYLGYYVGGIDGIIGYQTEAAARAFQKDFFGIAVDGIISPETEKAMKHAVAYGMPAKTEPEPVRDFWEDIEFFQRKEFACKCGKYCDGFPAEPAEALVRAADGVRKHFGAPAHLSSGVRCQTHNANVGGEANSRHLLGKAMDFRVEGKTAAQVLEHVQKLPQIRYAYAIDENYVHMDVE